MTALFIAAESGHAAVVTVLLAGGAGVDAAVTRGGEQHGATALFVAAQHGRDSWIALATSEDAVYIQKRGFASVL